MIWLLGGHMAREQSMDDTEEEGRRQKKKEREREKWSGKEKKKKVVGVQSFLKSTPTLSENMTCSDFWHLSDSIHTPPFRRVPSRSFSIFVYSKILILK